MIMHWRVVGTRAEGTREVILTHHRETAEFLFQQLSELGCKGVEIIELKQELSEVV